MLRKQEEKYKEDFSTLTSQQQNPIIIEQTTYDTFFLISCILRVACLLA